MSKKYKNPPLVEIVCEFRFDLENPDDAILPGLLYAEIKKNYPIRKQKNIGSLVPTEKGNNTQEFLVKPIAQFFKEDESMIVQVGYDMLSINCVKKYPHWEKFKPEILKIYNLYQKITNPKSIKRIGLRCINKIIIEETNFDLSKYFYFYPTSPHSDKGPINKFVIHIEQGYQDMRDRLIMKNATSIAEQPNQTNFILDFDYAMVEPNKIELNNIEEWLEIAHDQLNISFEASITDELKINFDK